MVALVVMCLVMPQQSNWAGNEIQVPLLTEVFNLEEPTAQVEEEEKTWDIENKIEHISYRIEQIGKAIATMGLKIEATGSTTKAFLLAKVNEQKKKQEETKEARTERIIQAILAERGEVEVNRIKKPVQDIEEAEEQVTDEQITEEQITEEQVTAELVTEELVTEEKVGEEKAAVVEEATIAAKDVTDTRDNLSSFYNALKHTDAQAMRVIHYGDSQIEEDRLTTQLRRALQQQYGGGGVGLIPLHQTIPTRTIWQSIQMNGHEQQINQGPKRYLVYGPKSMRRNSSTYGVMGQVAVMDNNQVTGSEDIVMQVNGKGKSKNMESYFNRIRIIKSGTISVEIERATSQQGDVYIVPDSTCSATIHLKGRGDIYGISLEQDKGVMVDNIPMRGCSGAVFTSMGANELQNYFRVTNTKLIILQFGGNVMPFTTTRQQVRQYIIKMQTQIQYLKYLAPDCSILFVGPSDMIERRDGQLQTYEMIPIMDESLQRMAIEEGIGYFSLYQHMGGKNSMLDWKEKGWASGDYIHFTRKGADKAGEMLAEWLMKK